MADDEKSAKSTRSMKSVLSHKSNKSSGEQATDRPSTPLEVELAVISIPDVEEVKAPVSMEVEATVPPIEDTAAAETEVAAVERAPSPISSVISGKSAPSSDASPLYKAGVEPLKWTVSDVSISLLSETPTTPSPKSADGWVVVRDVAVTLFDVAGDWIYLYLVSARIAVLCLFRVHIFLTCRFRCHLMLIFLSSFTWSMSI